MPGWAGGMIRRFSRLCRGPEAIVFLVDPGEYVRRSICRCRMPAIHRSARTAAPRRSCACHHADRRRAAAGEVLLLLRGHWQQSTVEAAAHFRPRAEGPYPVPRQHRARRASCADRDRAGRRRAAGERRLPLAVFHRGSTVRRRRTAVGRLGADRTYRQHAKNQSIRQRVSLDLVLPSAGKAADEKIALRAQPHPVRRDAGYARDMREMRRQNLKVAARLEKFTDTSPSPGIQRASARLPQAGGK